MVEPLSDERLTEIRAAGNAAESEVIRLCEPKPGGRWRMSIPANPARDSDLILIAATQAIKELLVEVDRLRAELARYRPAVRMTPLFVRDPLPVLQGDGEHPTEPAPALEREA